MMDLFTFKISITLSFSILSSIAIPDDLHLYTGAKPDAHKSGFELVN